ncbi:MAG TPA: phosphatidylserine/phosphatidylglycerophosphate/cardiolipin synthase family protein [Candidatus Limnocylindrales bacterium]|nr:phosphatidylserine/phosphatidylglycerophosphate/cardiolipin synthase family protein [Candidatus Limnocylindrales bacterium]
MSRRRTLAMGAGLAAATAAMRRRKTRVPTDPFDPNAVRAETAAVRTAELVARPHVRRADLALTFAPAIATTVDPLLHGNRYFPRILEDIAGATDHVHLLIYGYKPGDIGTTFLEALSKKVAEGVEVRLAVDAIGSEVDLGSKALFRQLREAGIEVVAHDGIVVLRKGELGAQQFRPHAEDLLHFDHRKMVVVDGRVGYVGGSGIEDHYNDERFYDVMCRVEGPIVAQLAAVFLISWRNNGGDAPDDPSLLRYFPPATLAVAADAPLHSPTTVLWNVPGTGHHPISDTIERALEDAATEIHIVNPYISNRAILERLLEAALRGVRVRLIAPGKPTPPYPAAAFRHWYGRLMDAGVEILLHPEMAHAKVLRIDDQVLIGGCNLDDLSLFRNDELDLLFADPAVAELTERQIFDQLVAMSTPASATTAVRQRVWNAAMDRVSRFL